MPAVPPPAECLPRGTLTADLTTTLNPSTYRGRRFTNPISFNPGTFNMIDCEWANAGPLYPSRTVTVDHCKILNGSWFENGGQAGWRIMWSTGHGNALIALRPQGPGTYHVSDSWFFTSGTPFNQDIHTEVVQHRLGADGVYERCAFSCEPRWDARGITPITGIVSMEAQTNGANTTFTDCVFGYHDGQRWVEGARPGHWPVYNGQARFVRPTVIHGTPDGTGKWAHGVPAVLIDPIYKESAMPAVYLCDVIGDGLTLATAFRYPDVFGLNVQPLLIDTFRPNKSAMKALIVHGSNTVTGSGIRKLAEAATGPALLTLAQTTAPSGALRNVLNTYADTAGLTRFRTTSWLVALQDLVDQVNPGVDVAAVLAAA